MCKPGPVCGIVNKFDALASWLFKIHRCRHQFRNQTALPRRRNPLYKTSERTNPHSGRATQRIYSAHVSIQPEFRTPIVFVAEDELSQCQANTLEGSRCKNRTENTLRHAKNSSSKASRQQLTVLIDQIANLKFVLSTIVPPNEAKFHHDERRFYT
jgi:hypothetical protein